MKRFLYIFSNPQSVYDALIPTLLITYVCGVTPFCVSGSLNHKKPIETTLIGYLYSILNAGFCFICFAVVIIKDQSYIAYFFDTDITKVGDTLIKSCGLAGMTAIFGASLLFRYSLINLLKLLNDIDKELLELGVFINYKYTLNNSVIFTMVIMLSNISFSVGSFLLSSSLGTKPSFFEIMTFFPPQFFIGFIVQLFLALVINIKHRYKALNQILSNMLSDKDVRKYKANSFMVRPLNIHRHLKSFTMFTVASKKTEDLIDDCMKIHNLIYEASTTANKYFKYQLLVIISAGFLITVFDAYYLLEAIFRPGNNHSLQTEFILFFLSHSILLITVIVGIVEGSSNVINESILTAPIVHKLLNQSKDNNIKQKLSYFSMQLIHQKVGFTAAGIFNIDRTLYFTISGAATTYLIILLQFAVNDSNAKIVRNSTH